MLTYKELQARTDAPAGSAWGLFGADDQLGTINLLTPQRVLAGSRSVRRGAVFNLDLALDAIDPPLFPTRKKPEHHIFQRNDCHRDDYLDQLYLQVSTQIDGLRHMGNPDHGFYNGMSSERFVPGDPTLSISHWAEHGIVGRAVLVDVARHLERTGQPIDHRQGGAIPVHVVEEAAQAQGVDFEPGDILLLRFGFLHHYFNVATDDDRRALPTALRSAGLLQSHDTLAWLWDHQFALVAADNVALECLPPDPSSPFVWDIESRTGEPDHHQRFMHRLMIPLLGMPMGELWALDALADDCAADGIYQCLLVAKPLNLVGGVGSPANAVAIK